MKQLLALLASAAMLLSCNKKEMLAVAIEGTVVALNASHSDMIQAGILRVKDSTYDKSRFIYPDALIPADYRSGYVSVIVGNSIVENSKWDTAARNFMLRSKSKLLNRGVAGSRYIDLVGKESKLVTCYNHLDTADPARETLVELIDYMMENELSWEANGATHHGDTFDLWYNKYMCLWLNEIRKQVGPKLKIVLVSGKYSPFHVRKGLTAEITQMNQHRKNWVESQIAQGLPAAYVQLPETLNDPLMYRPAEGIDGIHFRSPGDAYSAWYRSFEPEMINVPITKDTISEPPAAPVISKRNFHYRSTRYPLNRRPASTIKAHISRIAASSGAFVGYTP